MQFVTATRLLYHVHIRRISDAVRSRWDYCVCHFMLFLLQMMCWLYPAFIPDYMFFFFHVSLDTLLKIEKTHFLAT